MIKTLFLGAFIGQNRSLLKTHNKKSLLSFYH
ncbi:hypothetical protein N408_04260 [Helicobacter pylori FD703]|nr:hypothetical protein N408_04260 [Helicobacter pylori FD703]